MIPQLITILLLTIGPQTGFAPLTTHVKVEVNGAEFQPGNEVCAVLLGPIPLEGWDREPSYYRRSCRTLTDRSWTIEEYDWKKVPWGTYQAWAEVIVKGKVTIRTPRVNLTYLRGGECDPRRDILCY